MIGGIRLRLYKVLKLHRGEERKTLLFLLIHLCLSASLGLLSSAIDPLYLKHRTGNIEFFLLRYFEPSGSWIEAADPNVRLIPFLLLFGAVLLVCIGIVYSGFTDRSDKALLFSRTMVSVVTVCLVSFVLWLLDRFDKPVPLMFSLLYTWRFVAGVFLLMIFWDLAQVYFDARQAKRLFPLMFASGAVGYAGGSILVSPFAAVEALGVVFFLAMGFCVASDYLLRKVRQGFCVVSPPRYREKTLKAEISQGFDILRENEFLRNLLLSTALFGIAAGFIMMTYHAVIDRAIRSLSGAAGFMAFQRAVATILEAVIVTQVLSQTRPGGASGKGILIKAVLLSFGLVAYVASMIGVADFTRQIAMALLSPAVLTSYAVLSSWFRGRATAINTLVVAPAGMGAAALFVLVLSGRLNLHIFIGIVILALILRLLSNNLVSRSYLRHLRRGFEAEHDPAASLTGVMEEVLGDEVTLKKLLEALSSSEPPVCRYVWKTLASRVRGQADFSVLARYRPDEDSPAWPDWLVLAGRYDYPSIREETRRALESHNRSVRISARAAAFAGGASFPALDPPVDGILTGDMTETLEAVLMVPGMSAEQYLEPLWEKLSLEGRRDVLIILSKYPREVNDFVPLLGRAVSEEVLLPSVLSCLERARNVEPEFLIQHFNTLPRKFRADVITYLSEVQSADISRFLSKRFLARAVEFITPDQAGWQDSLTRQKTWYRYSNNELLSLALALLRSPVRIAPEVKEMGLLCEEEGIKTAACLYRAWRNGKTETVDPCFSLVDRMMKNHIEGLVRLVAACAGLGLTSVDQRELLHGTVSDIGFTSCFMRGKVLEAIESCLPRRTADFIAAFLEDLTEEERELRIFSCIRGFYISFRDLISLWYEAPPGDEGAAEDMVIEHFYSVLGSTS